MPEVCFHILEAESKEETNLRKAKGRWGFKATYLVLFPNSEACLPQMCQVPVVFTQSVGTLNHLWGGVDVEMFSGALCHSYPHFYPWEERGPVLGCPDLLSLDLHSYFQPLLYWLVLCVKLTQARVIKEEVPP